MTLQLPRLTIITLNCRVLRDDTKRRKLFHHLRTLQADIICLQETHCSAADERYWTNIWAGPVVRTPWIGNRSGHPLITGSIWPLPWWTTSTRLSRGLLIVISPFTTQMGSN